ncbi:MAG: hypothetical protein Q8O67_34175 [Deltaproteobacteria bacterium]|nr:hypothetical protein [Deltaproteobacteria bacterium]
MIFKPYSCFETGGGGLGKCAVVDALHTPGHTPASVSLVVADRRGVADASLVLTGATRFVGAVGRPDMSGKPSSTIAFEKRWNPLLSTPREEFIDALCDVPPKPAEMAQILRNQGREGSTP